LLAAAWTLSPHVPRLARRFDSPLVALVAVFVMLAAVSVLFSHDPAQSAVTLPGLLLFLLVPVAIDTVRRQDQARQVLLAVAAVGLIESLYSLWQYAHGGGLLTDRIRGGLSHYMTFSAIAMIAGCLLLAWVLEERGRRRWIGALALVPFTAIALTLTRGAYVGTLAALAVYLAVRRPRGLLLAIPLAAVLIAASPREVRQRFVSIVDLEDETSRDRLAMARAGLRMIADRPIFGHGPEMIKPYYVLYRDEDAPRWRVPHLHNNVLQIAASAGIFAAAAYLAIAALVLARTVVRLRAAPPGESGFLWAGPLMAVTALTFAGLFEYNFGDTEVLIGALIAMAVPFSRAVTPARGG
jgi:O-antigen ligase